MIYAKEPNSMIMPKVVCGLKPVDYAKTRKFYRVNFKFYANFGIFRANGFGPGAEGTKRTIRKFYELTTREKPPRKFNDLMQAFADKGFTVTEVTLTGKYGNMSEKIKHIVG